MKIIWLQAFVATVKYNSFSAAAEELYTSQANISKYIGALEKDLGVVLFDRSARNAKLTDDGKSILSYAEKIISDFSGLQQCIAERKAAKESSISIFSVPLVHLYNLHGVLAEFSQKYSDVQLEMVETDVTGVLQGLEAEEESIGIMRTCALQLLPKSVKWNASHFISDELVLLCNKNHRLATAENPSLADCLAEKLIILNTGFIEYRMLLGDYGIPASSFSPTIKCAAVPSLVRHIENNLGISLITCGMARNISDNENIVVRHLAESPSFPLSIVTRTDTLAPLASSLIHKMLDAINAKIWHFRFSDFRQSVIFEQLRIYIII